MEELRIEADGSPWQRAIRALERPRSLRFTARGKRRATAHSTTTFHTLLPPAGIGVVTFDRRVEGESTGDSTRGRFALQTEDAPAVVEAIGAKRVSPVAR